MAETLQVEKKLAAPSVTTEANGKLSGLPGFRIEVVDDVDALRQHVPAWDDLAREAIEPNPFYESWMLVPAAKAFAAGTNLIFVFAYLDGPERLCGFFPLERSRFKRLPISLLRTWRHLHCFLCTPLLRQGHAPATMRAFMEWARHDPRGARLLEWNTVPADGPFQRLLIDFFHETGMPSFVEESHLRALWQAREDVDTYLRAALSGGGRQDFRRKRKRLGEQGRLDFRFLEPGGDVELWTRWFLELEASGWKGDMKTALAANPIERDYFIEIARAAFERGQLQLLGLFLDGKPIAFKCNFLAGDGAFVFKPAYDEAYSRFSPGALLELDNMELCHQQQPPIRWMDSCTVPNHPMWNRLWAERRPIQSLLLSTGRRGGDLLVALRPLIKWLGGLRRGKAAM
jgi:CelD/BcsL family acetyltransferase involved in cellulose biosynthesis